MQKYRLSEVLCRLIILHAKLHILCVATCTWIYKSITTKLFTNHSKHGLQAKLTLTGQHALVINFTCDMMHTPGVVISKASWTLLAFSCIYSYNLDHWLHFLLHCVHCFTLQSHFIFHVLFLFTLCLLTIYQVIFTIINRWNNYNCIAPSSRMLGAIQL